MKSHNVHSNAYKNKSHGDIMSSMTGLLLRNTSGSVDQLQSESLLMLVDPDTTESRADARGLGCHLGPCWCLRAVLPLGPC